MNLRVPYNAEISRLTEELLVSEEKHYSMELRWSCKVVTKSRTNCTLPMPKTFTTLIIIIGHLGDPGVDGRTILSWISRNWDVGVWTGSSWLRIGTGGVLL